MISTTTLILIVAGVLLTCISLAAAAIAVYFFYSRVREFLSLLERFVVSVGLLSKVSQDLADVPKFISGHAKAAQAMSVQVGRLVTSVAAFEKLLVSPTSQGRDALSVPREEDADKHFRMTELLIENPEMSMEEAEAKSMEDQALRATMPLSLD